jgi:nucleoside-diphosphate-sugar epimerase
MSRFLITGGAGFIGSSLAEKLAEDSNNSIVIVDSLLTGQMAHVPQKENVTFIKADVCNYDEIAPIMTSQPFDYVYHYAAVVGVQRTLDNPLLVLSDTRGFYNILTLCKSSGVQRVLYASSSEVYGEPVEVPLHEETSPLNARLPYAVVKNVGECYVRSFKQEHNLDYTIFRFFNTYGPKQSNDFVVSRFLDAALEGRDIMIYGKGDQMRSFCYIDDNLTATINALTDPRAINQVYNIGSGIQVTVLELAETIIKLTNTTSKIVYLPALKEGDMTRRQPHIGRMIELLGHKPCSLEEGLKAVIEQRRNS